MRGVRAGFTRARPIAGSAGISARMSAKREECLTLYLTLELQRCFLFAPSALMRAEMPALPAIDRVHVNADVVVFSLFTLSSA